MLAALARPSRAACDPAGPVPAAGHVRLRRDAYAEQQRKRPATLADIDLGALGDRMEAVTEKAAQDDPAALRRRIADLERKLRQGGSVHPRDFVELADDNERARARIRELEAREPEQIEVPVLAPGDMAALEQAITGLRDIAGSLEIALSRATAKPAAPRREPVIIPAPENAWPRTVPDAEGWPMPAPDKPVLSKAQRAILTVLAQFPDGRTVTQIAMLTGYSSKGGGFRNSLGALRTAALIERGDPVRPTADGIAALGDGWEPLPEGPALLDHWVSQLGKAEGLILQAVVSVYPGTLTTSEAAEMTGYSPAGGGFRNALGRLRTLQLISGSGDLRANETLASEVSHA